MTVKNEVHVLIVTMALQGHMNPMFRFAKQVASQGVHVTLATTEVARSRMNKSKTSTKSQSSNIPIQTPAIDFEFFSDGLSLDFDRNKYITQFLDSIQKSGSENLSNLITDLLHHRNKKFSCLIMNPFMPWVADVAEQHEIPCAVLWIQSCSVFSIYYRFCTNPNQFPSLEDVNNIVELPCLPKLEVREIPSFILPAFPNSVQLKKVIAQFVENLRKIKWVLGNTFHALEMDVIESMNGLSPISSISSIGPLVSPFLLGQNDVVSGNLDMWEAEEYSLDWLERQSPASVIYISFGSITVLNQNQMDSIAAGLISCNQQFFWVVKPPEKDSGEESGELSEKFLEETRGRGLVVKWCPQEKVLMNKAIGGFMTHCGWNSVLETVVAGVPVICYPGWTDQPMDARLLVDVFKIGVRMRDGDDGVLTAEEVERCITEITVGPRAAEMKMKAVELMEAAKNAVADGGSSDRCIKQFIKEISGYSA